MYIELLSTSEFKLDEPCPAGEIELIWSSFNHGRRRRRSNFPSWSLLGCEGECKMHESVDIGRVSFLMEKGQKSLPALTPGTGIISPRCSQLLQLELDMTEFIAFPYCPSGESITRYEPALRCDGNIHISLTVVWDLVSSEFSSPSGIKIALLPPPERSPPSAKHYTTAFFLLLRNHGTHYERIGLGSLQYSTARSILIDADRVPLYTQNRMDWQMDYLPHLGLCDGGKYFTRKTAVLG